MKKDRHSKMEVKCVWCGTLFFARKERVDKGQGRYCGKECFDNWQRKQKQDTVWGRKDLATCYKTGDRYVARWYDSNGDTVSLAYPRWWWEINVGEIPEGFTVLPKDGDALNIDPGNFELSTRSVAVKRGYITRRKDPIKWEEFKDSISKRLMGHGFSNETLAKMSASHLNKPAPSGENHWKWRGGKPRNYPKEFFEIRQFIIDRDNSKCQICSRLLTKNWHIHHRDGEKEHNDQNNLLTLCASCHGKVHSRNNTESAPIMALRSELYWNSGII